jgi:hypothetical protein
MPVLLLLLTLLVSASPVAAQTAITTLEQHAYELDKVSPAAFRALQRALPASVKSVPWIYRLRGVAGLMAAARLGGQPYLGGNVCKPHDCADNKFAYLVTRDGTRALGLIKSDSVRGASNLVIGSPTPEERAVLDGLLLN